MDPSEVVARLLKESKERPARPPTRAELLGMVPKRRDDDEEELWL